MWREVEDGLFFSKWNQGCLYHMQQPSKTMIQSEITTWPLEILNASVTAESSPLLYAQRDSPNRSTPSSLNTNTHEVMTPRVH